jgi:hypothetical protein
MAVSLVAVTVVASLVRRPLARAFARTQEATPTFALILWAPANAAQAEFSNCDMVFYNAEYCRNAKQITFDIAAQHFLSEQDTSPSGFPKRPAS